MQDLKGGAERSKQVQSSKKHSQRLFTYEIYSRPLLFLIKFLNLFVGYVFFATMLL
jgi:hypothetical protein